MLAAEATGAGAAALAAFLAVFPAELPDKTMVATLVLTTRFGRPLAVWSGVAAAFTIHVAVAAALGSLLVRLPDRPVDVVVAVLFATGAVVMWRSSSGSEGETQGWFSYGSVQEGPEEVGGATTAQGIAARSFAVVLVAELGDLTQLATAGMSARTGQPVAVAVGALAALWAVAGLAAAAGARLLRVLPVAVVRRLAAGVFAALAVWTAVEALRG